MRREGLKGAEKRAASRSRSGDLRDRDTRLEQYDSLEIRLFLVLKWPLQITLSCHFFVRKRQNNTAKLYI